MRLKIILKSKKNRLKIPFNYNHIVSAIIYNKIADIKYAEELHSSNSYKFFTFSQLNIHKFKRIHSGFLSQNGKIDFLISSPDDYLIKSLVEGFLNDLTINFIGEDLLIEKVELLPVPDFEEEINVKTLSPIISRTKKEVDGELKIWDLAPGDHFFKNLENTLIYKYLEFNGLESNDKNIKIFSEMRNVKRKRIIIEKGDKQTYHRAYMMDLILKGDKELLRFAYDAGLGEKSGLGFGMVKVIN
ncbi:CRISPR-associated protein Cas6 [Methanobrevibacter ruminantium M1]|uniref:CRISPR-associated endoribonuclease n=1 Tax=Methanobrevibacter ruminantium (strain ATCC 35063 / DSM 1093 / JCM 13430 / OCM 146 / M1) TaxID=634498 RepID=D3E282_METRM|nr:CRISPR-associated endoribonuclease Cas6 [Methanobrevibacter ruminantium]ADC46643.1 CRISPR-associated protein Cas6 [Methanobrevibacter ruminantium M1]